MEDSRQIDAAMWLMILIQVIGNVDPPGKGPRKLPPPRAFVPIIVGFSIIQLVADAGLSRAAKAMAWLVVAAAAVLGPFGQQFVSFITSVANSFAIPSQQQTAATDIAGAAGVTGPTSALTPTPPTNLQ